MTSSSYPPGDAGTHDEDLLADLFDTLLQDILEGRTPDLDALHPDRPDLKERIQKTWALACSVAGRREPSRPAFGGYEILQELGHGGMGTVYLARHQTLQRNVAVKVLPQSLAMSPMAKQRFLEEARALAQIRHENVVHVHRVVDHTEMLAFEMEYVDGPSLQRLVVELRQQAKPLTTAAIANVLGLPVTALGARTAVEWFVRLTIRIARALAVVHRHGLVHRDVKPSNILLRTDGTPVLADFGLALQSEFEGSRTRFAGTPVYAAPERLRDGDAEADARTDVYSLGVTLYEALTLTPPFEGSSTHEVLRRIESGNMLSLRTRAPHVSRDLATVTQKAMEPDPRHRYATADEFADDLERLLNLQPIHARPAGPLRRGAKFVRRHSRIVGAALASAVLVTAVLWPLVAHAAAATAARADAASARHSARSRLLSPSALPATWGGGQEVRQESFRRARLQAIDAALTDYDRARSATPDDEDLALEGNVVRSLRAVVAGEEVIVTKLPPLSAAFVANAKAKHLLADGVSLEDAPTNDADRLAAGTFAFLLGDQATSLACWRQLKSGVHEDPFVDACLALQAAGRNPARSYARLFHAVRAFPQAPALALALTDAALAAGDLQEARQRLAALPADVDPQLDSRRKLLEADLLAAEGKSEAAQVVYRSLVQETPGDPTPQLRIADLELVAGNRERARGVYRQVLQIWPNLPSGRVRLARMALQEHDIAGYLGQLRLLMAQHRRGVGDVTADLAEALRLGGLQDELLLVETDGTGDDARRLDGVPLSSWLRPETVAAIRQTLEVAATFDTSFLRAAEKDTRPLVDGTLAGTETLLRLPQLCTLPGSARLSIIAAAPGVCWFVRHLGISLTLPFTRVLGDPITTHRPNVVFTGPEYDPHIYYGLQCFVAGDLDGDTLDELVVTAPSSDTVGQGRIEFRSLHDGALLRTWNESDLQHVFARAVTPLADVDGDSCLDLVIGRPLQTRTPGIDAIVELRSGRTGAVIWQATDPNPSFGAALATIGDFDGDGCRDVLVGISPMDLRSRGHAIVLSGRTGLRLHEIEAEEAGTWFGGDVANAGDLDDDGVDDFVVGGNYGNAPGLVCTYDGRTGKQLTSFTEEREDQMFGTSVRGLGDIDGDGRSEVAVSAPAAHTTEPGRVIVFSSKALRPLYELRGEGPREMFGIALCRLRSWLHNNHPALAIAARQGGPAGSGYVRVFDLSNGEPIQTGASANALAFGVGLADLGDRDGKGFCNLGVILVARQGNYSCWSISGEQLRPDGNH